MTGKTYYQRNKEMVFKRTSYYYENSTEETR